LRFIIEHLLKVLTPFSVSVKLGLPQPDPLALTRLFGYFPPAVAKVYIVSFRTHDDRRPSKFIVLADSIKSAIKIAWEHGGADFRSRFDKSTAAGSMIAGAL
jgi:hypothetical protein